MIKRKCIFLLTFFLVVPMVFSTPLEELISSGNIEKLRSGDGLILETRFTESAPVLIPNDDELRQFVTGVLGTISHNIVVEALYLYEKPEQSHTSSDNWDNAQKTRLFNQLLAISTLEGIQYYSASRGTMRTFFEYSRVIDQPNRKNPLPDPVFSALPASFSLYTRQKDLTFGDNTYLYDFKTARNGIFFVQENLSALTIGIIPAVRRGNLKSVFAVFDCGDTLLIYAVSLTKALSFSSLHERIGASFSNRAEAVINWFTGRADLALSW